MVAALVWTLLVGLSGGLTIMFFLYRDADRERSRAESNFRAAKTAVDGFLTRVSQERLLDVPGLQPLRQELVEVALAITNSSSGSMKMTPASAPTLPMLLSAWR